jgi:hypothetical protein
VGVPVNPAETPELGSLLLFAGGVAALGGYALVQAPAVAGAHDGGR